MWMLMAGLLLLLLMVLDVEKGRSDLSSSKVSPCPC